MLLLAVAAGSVGVGVGVGGVDVCVCECEWAPQFRIFKFEAVGYFRGLSICHGWGVLGYMAHAMR